MRREQIEQLLPDYCFGHLTPEEAAAVEQALRHYPDLYAEAEQLRAVFNRLEAMDYLREVERRSSTLSCLVLQRWEERKRSLHRRLWRPVLTILLPALGLAFIALWWSWQHPFASPSPDQLPPLTAESTEPFPYADGLVTFAYWSSGLPPLEQFTPVAATLTAHDVEELTALLSSITAEPLPAYARTAP